MVTVIVVALAGAAVVKLGHVFPTTLPEMNIAAKSLKVKSAENTFSCAVPFLIMMILLVNFQSRFVSRIYIGN